MRPFCDLDLSKHFLDLCLQVVEKALVIREKKEKYIAREKEALLLCKHPMVVRLYSTFQVIRTHPRMNFSEYESVYNFRKLIARAHTHTHVRASTPIHPYIHFKHKRNGTRYTIEAT